MKRMFILFLSFLAYIIVNAQGIKNVNKWIAKGEKAEKKENFEKAIHFYKIVEELYNECDTIDDKLGGTLSIIGSLYFNLGDYSKALEYGTKAMEVQMTIYGENHPNYATSLGDLALLYSDLGDYSSAIEYETKALKIRKAVLGENHPDYAHSLNNLAEYNIDCGDFSMAFEYGTKALEIRRAVLGEKHPDYANSLYTCAKIYYNLGNYSMAVEYGTKAVEIDKVALGKDDIYYSTLLEGLAIFLSKLGDYSKALEYEKQVMKIRQKFYGENHPDYANSLSSFAVFYHRLGEYSNALVYEEQAMKIRKTILGDAHPDYAISLSNLAFFYSDLGDYSKAIEYEMQAMEIKKAVLGENHPDYVTSLNNLANYYSALGKYSKSIEYYYKALEVAKTVLGEDHPDYAAILSNFAEFCSNLGDYSRALECYTKAIEIEKNVFGEKHLDYASSLSLCAIINSESGNYSKALEYETKALEIRKAILGEKHPDYANSLNNLAYYYSDLGDYSRALEFCTRAIEIDKNVFGEKKPNYAISIGNLATYYSKLGNHSVAIDLGTKAMDIFKTQYGKNDPIYAKSLKKLSGFYFSFNDYSKAMDCFTEYLSIVKNDILSVFSFSPAFQRSLYWKKYSADFTEVYPALFYQSNNYDTSSLYNQSALFSKGLLLSTIKEMNKLINESGDTEAFHLIEELRTKRMILHKLYNKPMAELYINTDSLKKEADLLEWKLVERSKVYGDYTKKLKTTWLDVKQSLGEGELAVEFLSFNVLGTDSTLVAALTLRNDDKEPKFIPLFELRQLQGLSDTIHYISHNLTSLVWQPLHNELQGIKTIYFSAAGVLHKIGIEYAPEMENYEMFRLSSTREIIDIKEDTGKNIVEHSIELYGGIDYDTSSSKENPIDATIDSLSHHQIFNLHRAFVDSLDLRGRTISYLPGTSKEVQNISALLKQANYSTKVHLGSEATENSVKALSGKAPTILHISTHGFYYSKELAKKKDFRYIFDMENQKLTNEEDKDLLRSGLLMAGANKTLNRIDLSMEDDDGILTAMEIAQLDLHGTELVVLSACETGRGDITQGEGVFGLQRGFKKAGVKTILMSLWKVNDFATEILMTEFYNKLCEGKSKRESFRLAQKKVRDYKDSEGNHLFQDPYYWAGFVLLD